MHALIARLYPICRSITGNGFRETLRILQEFIPLRITEVPTGEQVFDWTIPKEWNIRDAYIRNSRGEKVVDFQKLNLHVLNYSTPIQAKASPVGTEETSLLNSRTSRLGALPDIVLQGKLGLLHQPQSASESPG